MQTLKQIISREIEMSGPMSVGRYMELCLAHPVHGYYQSKNPLGAEGDFTTAPEISQLFGELIGAWLVHVWHLIGKPTPFALVELGPGRGTLMKDVLRVAKSAPDFINACSVHLVETSTKLRDLQSQTLVSLDIEVMHHNNIETLPKQPSLIVGNEFLDALQTNQWIHTDKGWNQKKIGLSPDGELVFGVDPTPLPPPKTVGNHPVGTLIEHSVVQDQTMVSLAKHIQTEGGAALLIDYGSLTAGTGDTLQAISKHQKVDPLSSPGDADLTTHIDFAHIADLVQTAGLVPHGAQQGAFLLELGLLERAGQLGSSASQEEREAISLAVERLAGDAGMGKLFKAFAFTSTPTALPGLKPMTDIKQTPTSEQGSKAP